MELAWPHFPGLRRVPVLLPTDAIGGLGDAVPNTRIAESLLGIRIAVLVEVVQPELNRVHADGVGGLLHRHLESEGAVGVTDAAVRPLLVRVGEDVDRFQFEIGDLVQILHVDPRAIGGRAARGTNVGNDLEVARDDRPVLVDRQVHLVAELRPVGAGDEVFEARVGRVHRPSGDLGQDGRVNFSQVDPAAVAVA